VKKQKNLDKKAYQSLLLSGVLWGFVPLFYKKSLVAVSILVFLALRFSIGALYIFATERKKFIHIPTKLMLGVIAFALVDMLLINVIYSIGIQKTTILHAAIIQLLNPFLVYLFAAIILKERPHRIVLVGSSIAVVGLLAIVISSVQSSASGAPSAMLGDGILCLGTAIGALTVVISRKMLSQKKRRLPPEQLGFLEYFICAMVVVSIVIATSSWHAVGTISGSVWMWIIAAGIISGGMPITLYYRSAKKLPAERLADISFVLPAVSSLVGIAFLGEKLTIGFVFGTSLVVFGLLIGHKKIHPVLIAHKIGIDTHTVQMVFRQPKRAYAYIAVETKNTFSR